MSTKIIFESHATTLDNEQDLASGWNDVELSELGKKQAQELGQRRAEQIYNAIFCSDLQRSYKTAEIAFGPKFPIIRDKRLRECDYGEFTQHLAGEVKAQREQRISIPFPGGESYDQAMLRMRNFLLDLSKDYSGKTVLIIGHRVTQYGLEHWILNKPLREIVTASWKWQPGWAYVLDDELVDPAIPKIIQQVGFDFSWSEHKVWALQIPTESMAITELTWHFDIPFLCEQGGVYNLKPRAVLEYPEKHPEEFQRTQKADLQYPIDIMGNKGRWLILDGLHRLMKWSLSGATQVPVRKVLRQYIPDILE